ncbi:MAG: replication protein [Clostridiales bacterium]|nr:replication protein [Clostridiales bacterium]
MANPHPEDLRGNFENNIHSTNKYVNYTKIPNIGLEELAKSKLSPIEYRILFVVWRYTYGFNRSDHDLSLSFIAEALETDLRTVQRGIKLLLEKRILVVLGLKQKTRKLSFNIDKFVNDRKLNDNMLIGNKDNDDTANVNIDKNINAQVDKIVNQEKKDINKTLKKEGEDADGKPWSYSDENVKKFYNREL